MECIKIDILGWDGMPTQHDLHFCAQEKLDEECVALDQHFRVVNKFTPEQVHRIAAVSDSLKAAIYSIPPLPSIRTQPPTIALTTSSCWSSLHFH